MRLVPANRQAVAIINDVRAMAGTATTRHARPLGLRRRSGQALRGHISTNGSAAENALKAELGLLTQTGRSTRPDSIVLYDAGFGELGSETGGCSV